MTRTTFTTDQLQDLMPLCGHLGIELSEAAPDRVVGRLPWREPLTTMGGAMHGGALMALADSIGGVCAFLNLPEGARTSTTASSTVFVRGLGEGAVTATSRPLHVGRSTIAVLTELTDHTGRLLAQTTQSQAVLASPGV
ncbi:MAG TPA: PaaI family thioesterase [Nocardioidaceae bacterium]|nr:PaaI family thioesterase [Nocardioidaceae bacterium]